MGFTLWEPVPSATTYADLSSSSVLIHADDPGQGIVASFVSDPDAPGNVVMQYARTSAMDSSAVLTMLENHRIGDKAAEFFPGQQPRIVPIPPIRWRQLGAGLRWRTPVVVIGAVLTGIVCLVVNTTTAAAAALPLAALVGFILWMLLRRLEPTRIVAAGDLHLDGGNVVEYAQQRQRGHRPEMVRLEERTSRVMARVADIKAEFGQLVTDIVYRIDNSALFDSAVPATERFQAALMAWDDASDSSIEERDALAAEIEIAYSVARANAESLGLHHLPATARPDARRAAKAARLAASSSSAGEREASLYQVARILDALALYYLPTVTSEPLPLDPPPPPDHG